jgi:hypothetical protein
VANLPDPRFCNCCASLAPAVPALIWNRPGLSAIRYRIGTFASFRQTMLDEIHRWSELTGLATREPDDHAITLLELFAAVGDVLTFYNERIANEMYLAQAVHKASIEQLVALVGYRPRPALSATGLLSFEIDEGRATRVGHGLKVMSVPGPDERPQIFETMEELAATGRLNAATAFAPFQPVNPLAQASRTATITSDTSELHAGDRLVLFGRDTVEEKEISSIVSGPDGTRLGWRPAIQHADFYPRTVRAAKTTRRLRFFGHNAPPSHNVYDTNPSTPPQHRWHTETIDGSFAASETEYPLDARIDDLKPGVHLLVDAGAGAVPRIRTAVITATDDKPANLGPLADTVTHVSIRQTVVGRPTVAALPSGPAVVLARSGGGHPSFLGPASAPPRELYMLATMLFASSDMAALTTSATRFDIFVRDAALSLQQVTLNGFILSPWTDRGGLLTSPPTAVALAGGHVRVFVRGADFALWTLDATGGPATWSSLGGGLTSPPAVVSPDGTRIAVFVRGPDRALWWRSFDGVSWDVWESLGGELDGAPAATASPTGRIDVFGRGPDGALKHRQRNGGIWRPWRDLGGKVAGDPAAVAGAPDWAAAIVRGADDQMQFIARIGDSWTPWIDQGGALASDPSAAIDSAGVQVAARHRNGTIATTTLSLAGATWSTHGDGLGDIPDRRATRIYETSGDDIEFRSFDYPKRAAGGWIVVPLRPGEDANDEDGLGALKKGRRILLSGGGRHHAAHVMTTFAASTEPGEPPDHLAVGFVPPLPETSGPVTLLGNIATASHGETQREDALGNGNAAVAFQSFGVPPGEISHLPEAAGVRPVPQVELRVGEILWNEVPYLFGHGIKERVFTLNIRTDADSVISGGDGIRAGARFPTGALNIRLKRRLGAGLEGNLKPGQLSIALGKPVGLKGVTNPLATSGGAPAESNVRQSAPNGVRAFGRIVSLADFQTLATASGLAARAHVTWVWNRLERTVHLTVAGPAGAPLSPGNLALLHAQLTASRDPNRPLLIANLVRVPIAIAAKLSVDPAYSADAVADAARAALLDAFAPESIGIGQPVHLSGVYAILQGVAGIRAADIDLLHLKHHSELSPDERAVRSVTMAAVQTHIRLYAARPLPADAGDIDRYQRAAFEPGPPPVVLPAEQAFIADGAHDVTLTVVGAL